MRGYFLAFLPDMIKATRAPKAIISVHRLTSLLLEDPKKVKKGAPPSYKIHLLILLLQSILIMPFFKLSNNNILPL